MNMKIVEITEKLYKQEIDPNEAERLLLDLFAVSGSLRYSEREIDFAYLAGVFNVSGIDGLQKEIERLKGLGKNPHDIIIAAREQ
jgi:hypothetical protein